MVRFILMGVIPSAALVTLALAHPGVGSTASFAAGFAHPLGGLDHIAAMVAVGLWAAVKGKRALWVWPLTFVAVTLVGGALGQAHVALPFVEPGILASVVVLGLMVALAVNPPLWVGAVIIGVFALLHGHAHGAEVPATMNGLGYAAGFALATAVLHAIGIALALTFQRVAPKPVNRLVGVICVAVGAGLSTGVF